MDFLLQEDGTYLLQEDGTKILLETQGTPDVPPTIFSTDCVFLLFSLEGFKY
jgi:hypothetical protein